MADHDRKGGHRLVLLGLLLGILLASLDQTVVGTSLPRIVAELGGLDRFTWLFSAYMLAGAVMVPVAGKLSDRLGRRPVFLAGMGLFLAGSVTSGLAQSMDQLIAFRFLQGLGAGVIFPVAFATVADLYAPADRGRVQGAFGAVFGISSILGPLIGGFLVDHTTWRWVFYVNLPVGFAAIAVTFTHFPRVQARRDQPLDLAGAALLSAALTAGLLVLLLGGSTFPWASAPLLALAAGSVAALALFLRAERRAADPLLPLDLFREPVFARSNLATLLLAVALFGVVAFLPLYMQAVVGSSATASGLVLTPLMLMVVAGSWVSGHLMKRVGYKVWILAGPLLAALGLVLLAGIGTDSREVDAVLWLLVLGVGLGFTMATYMVASQNVVERRHIGIATSTLTLMRTIGATLGVSVLGALFNHRMGEELGRRLSPDLAAALPAGRTPAQLGESLLRPAERALLPPGVVEVLREALASSLATLFLACAVACLAAFAASAFIRSVPLKGAAEYHGPPAEAPLPAALATEVPVPRRAAEPPPERGR